MSNSTRKGFANTDANLLPYNPAPDVSDDIQMSLSRLLAWDNDNELWRMVRISEDGALTTNNAGDRSSNMPIFGRQTIITEVQLCEANPKRYRLILQNQGMSEIYLSLVSGASGDNAYTIYPSDTLDLSFYTGALWAYVDGGIGYLGILILEREDINYYVT